MPPPFQSFEYFFDLPPELREQILSYVCVFPRGILVGGGVDGQSVCFPTTTATTTTTTITPTNGLVGGNEEEEEDADPPINLFLASPIFYRDAGNLYYGRNVFHLDFASSVSPWGQRRKLQAVARNGYAPSSSSSSSSSFYSQYDVAAAAVAAVDAGGWPGMARLKWLLTHPDAAGARRRIRSAVVYFTRFGGVVRNMLVPALGDMVLNGGLKRVSVGVFEAGIMGPMGPIGAGGELYQRTKDYAGNPVLRALLVVLTDPELERAELKVPEGAHAWFWCRFHQGGVSEGGRRAGCALSGNGEGFTEVDIHRLVDACGGDTAEFRIKKVDESRSRS